MKNIIKKATSLTMALTLLAAGSGIAKKNGTAKIASVHAAHYHCCCQGVTHVPLKCLTGNHYYYGVKSNCCGHYLYYYNT